MSPAGVGNKNDCAGVDQQQYPSGAYRKKLQMKISERKREKVSDMIETIT
jgi:hypothetical protein